MRNDGIDCVVGISHRDPNATGTPMAVSGCRIEGSALVRCSPLQPLAIIDLLQQRHAICSPRSLEGSTDHCGSGVHKPAKVLAEHGCGPRPNLNIRAPSDIQRHAEEELIPVHLDEL